ncbi:unnamed protein product [Ostreobium quekettii]|uniref:K Homology domain-containing protein n=1 Tax=Ostreobium quekettii TaxID=121088 RepID=A0A8S1J341_9CHLO|nr:unnamed protein product [Ostreobium quekettii]|eukprot:evm.model.scf_947.2 EVM.evm.TU.scf_947.2   scf_947:17946-25346(+)
MDELLDRALRKIAPDGRKLGGEDSMRVRAGQPPGQTKEHDQGRFPCNAPERQKRLQCRMQNGVHHPETQGTAKMQGGAETVAQGITGARILKSGAIELRTTLLVAGFLIGPGGSSIRDIVARTGAEISSWSIKKSAAPAKERLRVFVIGGSPKAVREAVAIFLGAVSRYKDLVEGKHAGYMVDVLQPVAGVEFVYLPPPKNRVPHAAGAKLPCL